MENINDFKDLSTTDKFKEYQSVVEELEELREEHEKLQFMFQELVKNNEQGWDQLRKELDQLDDLNDSLYFLQKILREKALCQDNKCPVFFVLQQLDLDIFAFKKKYDNITDPKKAEIRFKTDQSTLKSWKKDYTSLQYDLIVCFNSMLQIGIPNEIKQQKIENAHRRSLITIKGLGDAKIPSTFQVGKDIDQEIYQDTEILTKDDPELKKRFRASKEKGKKTKSEDKEQEIEE